MICNRRLKPLRGGALALFVSLLAAGCAVQPSAPVQETREVDVHPAVAEEEARWWNLRFPIAWPEEMAPAWHMGPLIAHRVAAPALKRHRDAVTLWRFHRRAARDSAGHRFSLIFFADPATAQSLYRDIEGSDTVHQLQGAGDLARLRLEDTGQLEVGATSDGKWNPAIQRSWPRFIMGVSRSWLGLVDELSGEKREFGSTEEMHTHYRAVQEELTALWQQEGGHAYLHHLSAIFGYQPLMMRF